MMAELRGFKLRGAPEKQREERERRLADISMVIVDERGNDRSIAVEVTTAMDEATRAGYSGAFNRIAGQVLGTLRARRLRTHVVLMFPKEFVASVEKGGGKKLRAIVDQIGALVADAITRPLPPNSLGWIYQDTPHTPEPGGLRLAGDLASRGLSGAQWVSVRPWHEARVTKGLIGEVERPEHVQAAIDEKAKIKYDRDGADEMWLLVVGGTWPASSLQMPAVEDQTYASPFDCTFYLDPSERKCVPLRTRKLAQER